MVPAMRKDLIPTVPAPRQAGKSRQEKLECMGFTFLRFHDTDVRKNLDGVLKRIECWINEFEGGDTP